MPHATEPDITAATRYCAVFGQPVRHSASPAMHNPALAALGLNWRYLAFEVQPESLRQALAGAKAMGFMGVNLTVPHKVLALDMMDVLDESARVWRAVNTVRFEGRDATGTWRPLREFNDLPAEVRLHGFNTDADAIILALREDLGVEVQGSKVVLLGAGGAGTTAALRLAAAGVSELSLINRTRSKGETVVKEIQRRYPVVKVSLEYPVGRVDLVVNATSLGLGGADPLPFDEGRLSLHDVGAVFDMIYRPAETGLLKRAKAAGCRSANGLGMLLYQGGTALELWTGLTAPLPLMRSALERNLYGS